MSGKSQGILSLMISGNPDCSVITIWKNLPSRLLVNLIIVDLQGNREVDSRAIGPGFDTRSGNIQ